MSLTLNNDPINLGDRLFHLTYGYGTVIEMNTDFFPPELCQRGQCNRLSVQLIG